MCSGKLVAFLLFSLTLGLGPACELIGAEKSLELEVGDPARRDQKAALVLDAITDTRTGELLSPEELAEELASARIVLVGESHTDINFHRVQLRIIQALRQAGRTVLVGLEMYPYTKQEFLDNWVEGRYTEEGFLDLSDWYESWGYHWNYYRDIFLYSRQHGVPMYALNTPRDVIAAVRKQGLENLTEEQREHLPPEVDTESDEHFELFKAFFDDDDEFHASMSDEQWRSMFEAQCSWDATFGYNALQVLESHEDPQTVLVILVGSGHTAYDLGIQRQVANWSDIKIRTVIPISVRGRDEREPVAEVQASYADYLWGLPAEEYPIYPSIGISTRSAGDEETRRTVIYVAEDSVAEAAGFQLGDLLLSMDGHPLPDRKTFARLMSEKRWGDQTVIRVERENGDIDLEVPLRRQPEAPEE